MILVGGMSVVISSCGEDDTPAPTLQVDSTSVTIDAEGTSVSIIIKAENTEWDAEVINGVEWLKASKSGNALSLSATKNAEAKERKGAVVVTAKADNKLNYTITVTQKGATAFITINGTTSGYHEFPGAFTGGKDGTDYKVVFKINSNVEWTLSGQVNWLNISPERGNGEVDLTVYPTSENNSDEEREAKLVLSGSGSNDTITVIQKNGLSKVYALPANAIALYDRFCWEYSATPNINTFQYIFLSETNYKKMTENELIEAIKKEEVLKYDDDWLTTKGYDSNGNRITSNSTYYFVSLATDKDGKYGSLKTVKMTTPAYLDENQDAFVSFSNFSNSSYEFQFDVKKQGFCNKYHIIYGVYESSLNTAVFAFEINYYLKNKKKHWLAKNDYYEWDIMLDYPNDHTFSYTSYLMSYFPVCFGYGWGIFENGNLSSDMLGFQVDTSADSSRQMKLSRTTDSPKDEIIKRSEVMNRAKSLRK